MDEWLHLVTKDTVIVIDAMRLMVWLSDPFLTLSARSCRHQAA
jgi:hypothetical protein